MSYKGITPPPETEVTKNLKFIYGHDHALVVVWLMVKEFPAPPTTKYGPFRCNMIHRIPPSRAHDDSKRKGDISQKFQNKKRNKKEIKKI